jgi:hypothetical protein
LDGKIKKSTAPYKLHNKCRPYIKNDLQLFLDPEGYCPIENCLFPVKKYCGLREVPKKKGII